MEETDQNPSPVFHDPHRRRSRWVGGLGRVVGAITTALIGITLISTLVNPVLPKLGLRTMSLLPQASHLKLGTAGLGKRSARGVSEVGYQQAETRLMHAMDRMPSDPDATSTIDYRSKLVGFYVNWDDASLTSLKQHLGQFDMVVPEWLHVAGPDSAVSADDPVQEAQTLGYVRQHRPGLPVVPLVNNFSQTAQAWDTTNLAKNLALPAKRAQIETRLLAYVRSQNLAGINIDFENLPTGSRADLVAFMTEISAKFHASGLTVSESVPANDPTYDYANLAKSVDFLVLMNYDEHWPGGNPGPVASQGWFDSTLAARLSQIPADKLIVGLGSYGYDWAQGQQGTSVTFGQAMATAGAAKATPALDPTSLNLHYDYTDSSKVVHHVWLLDSVSAFDEIASAEKLKPAGYALWRLGSEDPTIWSVFRHRNDLGDRTARALTHLDLSNGVAYEGTGEILRVTATPANGARAVSYDASSALVTSETVTSIARPYIIQRWGGTTGKKIALTFDDGPDPQWTPQILDVLDANDAPATFFVIGLNADAQPQILQRELNLGEEIGNHTFTHPDISVISPEQVRMQLDATQRLFESRLGVRSVLFRPPYGEDAEPDTPKQVAPLLETGQMGYYSVGMSIDPNDWARPGIQAIVDSTISQIEAGKGNVVLLHDGGGDRSQTVAALPLIIKELRARGYEFVTISDLVGLKRSDVMPPMPPGDRLIAGIDGASFTALDYTRVGLYWLFVAGIFLGVGRLVLVGVSAIIERVRDHRRARRFTDEYRPLVSVLVPAHNEEKVIVRSIEALLASDYQPLEIVMIDDGSDDDTFGVVRRRFAGDLRVRAFKKTNGGKAGALNFGIDRAQGEIVIGMDADTLFAPDAISKLVRHFADESVGAVAGNAKVGNRVNLLTRWQALEYITNQNLDRRAFDLYNCITVVPGAIGAWRRELVRVAGGFTSDTLAEDADLTLTVLEHGARIDYEDEALAYTEAPDTVRGLSKQRSRWVFGTMQTFWKHRRGMFNPKARSLGLVAMPNVLIFQIFFPLVSPVMDLVMALSIAGIWVQKVQHPQDYSPAAFEHILFYYALFLAVDFLASAVAFALEPKREQWSLLTWLFLQRFFYRQLMYVVVWRAVLHAVHGRLVGWHRVERKATVDQPAG